MCPRVFRASAGSVVAGVVVVVWCRRLGLHDQLTRQGVQLDRREEGGPSIEFNGGLRSTLSCFGQRLISPRRWAATGANANASAAGLGGHRRRVPPSFVEEFGILEKRAGLQVVRETGLETTCARQPAGACYFYS
jgi:hypothetical protein